MARLDELEKELEKVIAEAGTNSFERRRQFPKDARSEDSTNDLLHGILKALGIIGKMLAQKK